MSPPRNVQGREAAARETRILEARGLPEGTAARRSQVPPRAGQADHGLLGGAPFRLKRRDEFICSYTEDWPLCSRPTHFQVVKTPDTSLETERSTMWGYPSSTVPLEALNQRR